MSKRTIEIAVGIFVLLGIISLAFLALRVSGLSDVYTGENGYDITAEFDNVGGLKPKARVTIGGVQVGRVKAITFNKDYYRAVVHISIKTDVNNLPLDTKAHILTAGLLGDNYIGLEPGYSEEFIPGGGEIMYENTESAVILEELISKLVSSKASNFE